jgi:pyrrolidone-carboxylate peptidase
VSLSRPRANSSNAACKRFEGKLMDGFDIAVMEISLCFQEIDGAIEKSVSCIDPSAVI